MTEPTETLVQGTPAWRQKRLGKITASRFSDLLSQPRDKAAREAGEQSKTAKSYMLDLVAEILTGIEQGPPTTKAMQWGIDNEPAARELYEIRTGVEVQQIGFLEHPLEPMIGGSPDGLVGEDGGIEIKCPYNTRIHLAYMLGGVLPKEHVAQVQGHLWNSGRKWWDFVSYDPNIKGPGTFRLALWIHRVERDKAYIERLDKAIFAFRDKLLEALCQLKIGGRLV